MIQYRAIKEQHYHQDIGNYIAWGIQGSQSSPGVPGTVSVYISDIFLNEKEAADFAQRCTGAKLSLMHLADVVEDYLAG